MALLLSLMLGLGLLLVYLSLTTPARPAPAPRLRQPGKVEQLLHEAGVEAVSSRDFLLISGASGLAVCLGAQIVLGWPLVSLALTGVGAALPAWYLRNRADGRRAALQGALADAVDAVRSGVRTGMSVEEAITGLAANGPAVLRPIFRDMARDMRLSGFEEALGRARDRLADPVFDVVALSLRMSHQVGGRNLSTVLDGLAGTVRKSVQIQREVQAQQAKNVLSARVIAALPIALVIVIRGVNPSYLDAFGTPEGQAVMAGCLLSVAIGYGAMLWATRLPAEERVLQW
ncbi:MAG: hypothetical protein GEU75_13450 [Dehalococcoidia bacterium]|nr:hypothetical protein [Dehalococcoidia bacterium]